MDTNGTWMHEQDDKQPVFGEAMQAVMAKRGHELTLEEAQQLTNTLLDLIELGALVPVDTDGNTIPLPEPGSHKPKISKTRVLIAADDDVVEHFDAEDVAGLDQPASQLDVGP